nr:variable large family protein [Borrelia persica]
MKTKEEIRGGSGKMSKIIKRSLIIIMMVGIMGCNSGLVTEKEGLERKNSFLDSLVKIGQGFQEIFGVFGNVVGDALGFNVVKSDDNRSKVGEHFKKIGDGLTTTKNKLNELSSKISEAKNAEDNTVETVKGAIKGAIEIFEQLIAALTKLASVTNDGNPIGHNADAVPGAAEKAGVEAIIGGVQTIIEVAEKSGVKIDVGNAGGQVTAAATTDAPAVLGGANGNAGANAGLKLVAEVSKADPWAMIDKIKNAKATVPAALAGNNNNHEAGALAASNANAGAANNGAKTNADLVAAVALKAMTKGGKFSANNADTETVKAAAASAVNKVLGILDVIIRKTVANNLDKVREAFKEIQYSDTPGINATEASTTQPTTK